MNINDKIIIYQTEDGQTKVDVRMENDTVWLTQAQMAELFQTDRTSIVRHISNIYKVEELDRESTCAKIAQVQVEGKRTVSRQIPYFNPHSTSKKANEQIAELKQLSKLQIETSIKQVEVKIQKMMAEVKNLHTPHLHFPKRILYFVKSLK